MWTKRRDRPVAVYCPARHRELAGVLNVIVAAGAHYALLDTDADWEARSALLEILNGIEAVPTVVLPDRRVLVQPDPLVLELALARQGYRSPWATRTLVWLERAVVALGMFGLAVVVLSLLGLL